MEKRSSLINLPKEAIIETANKAVRLAKAGLSVVAGLLGLALVMVVLSLAGPAAARNQAREDLSDVGLMSAVTTVTVGADPTIIDVHIGTSTITATVKDASDSPVSDTFVIFTPTLGSITTNPYRYVEAEDSSAVTRTTNWTVMSNSNASGGKYLRSATVGDKLFYNFNGTSIAVIYTEYTEGGQFRVWIDGICSDTVDSSGSGSQWKQQWVTDTAPSGPYTLTVEVITPTVSSRAVYIDDFKSGTRTDASGVATATLTAGDIAGPCVITAFTDINPTVIATTTVTFTPGSPYTVTVEAQPPEIPVGGYTSTITATVRDQWTNVVSDTTVVTFTTEYGELMASQVQQVTDTTRSGVATAVFTSGLESGTATITATANITATGTTSVTIVGAPHILTVNAHPSSILIRGYTSTITATVVDRHSYPVVDTTPVTFTTSLGKLADGQTTYNTHTTDGSATAILTSEDMTGTATITATADSITGTTSASFIAPVAYSPILRKNYADTMGATWYDGFQVQNLGTTAAEIIIAYYNRDGHVVNIQRGIITPGQSETYYADTLEIPDNFDGSVEIASGQPLAVIANQQVISPPRWGSYTALSSGALTVNVPLVMRENDGWNTAISVQNTGPTTATVTLAFQPSPGSPGSPDTITDTIPPGAARLYDQRTQADLGPTFVGSAVVTSDEPVAAVVNETDGSILMSYTGFVGAGSTRVNVPLVMSQNSNWWTGVQVQNLGNFATDITIEFHPDPAQSEITPTLETVGNVAPGASANFLQRGDQWTGKFVGSAVVTSSQPMIAIVNELNEVDGDGMSYGGFTSGTTKISAPLVMYDNNDWYTGLQVQNIGTSTATIDLKVDGVWPARVYVAPGSSYTWYPMPWAKVGAATVESLNGQPLVGIVNEITHPYKAGENSMSYECFNEQ